VESLSSDAGFSAAVERVVALVREPIVVRTLLEQLTREGLPSLDAMRAIESARLARALDFVRVERAREWS
jgi:hypothetical protein